MTEQSKRPCVGQWESVGAVAARVIADKRPSLPSGLVDLPKVDLPRPLFHPGYPAAYLSKGISNE